MKLFRQYEFLCALVLATLFVGCTQRQQSPDELKEKTAQATADLKRDTKAVAEGIREGWSRDKPLDVNSASKDQLMALPGVSPGTADRIIAARPFGEPHELVTRHIVSQVEYDRFSDRVVAKK
jgi:DNA uptake protein ComE-like DNA-binding protein